MEMQDICDSIYLNEVDNVQYCFAHPQDMSHILDSLKCLNYEYIAQYLQNFVTLSAIPQSSRRKEVSEVVGH